MANLISSFNKLSFDELLELLEVCDNNTILLVLVLLFSMLNMSQSNKSLRSF